MKLRSALLAATLLAAPAVAKAEAVRGLYIGAGAGANWLQDTDVRGFTFPQFGGLGTRQPNQFRSGRLEFDTGFVGLGSIGYGLGNGLRFELEGNYRQNQLNKLRIGEAVPGGNFVNPPSGAGGDEEKYGAMINVLYDFDPNVLGLGFFPFPISPYVGVGVGWQHVKFANGRLYGPSISGPGQNFDIRSTGEDDAFAYQGIVGAAFPLGTAIPGLSLTTEYRFLGLAGDRSFKAQYFQDGIATRTNINTSDNYNHAVLIGLRYAFNAAPPPPPPAPVPVQQVQPARSYLVFFDWDRADLTARARQIISEAAQASTRVQVTRIEVNGFTDLSGTARYNQGLSVRRANAVAAELVRDGVPRSAIVARGFGESNPLVPTAQGVREPQNRRVEIILR